MKKGFISGVLLAASAALATSALAQDELPVLSGPYLGQTPAGKVAEPFGLGVISTQGYEYNGVFAPGMEEFYFIRGIEGSRDQVLIRYKQVGEQWFGEVMSPRLGQHTFSPDGKTMHLGRRYLTRTDEGWSERQELGSPFAQSFIMRLTSSQNGTYYFDTYDETNEAFPIRASRLVDGVRQAPEALSSAINTGTYISHPFIAPDESYLIWDATKADGFGDSDLYISYRQADGSWGEAINLGAEINSEGWDGAGYVTPDGKYLFFNRTVSPGVGEGLPNVDLYWVDAQFIEALRPKN
ncbi:PD40 domain-containing protein [Umboniibacter marinipuniceus]|uniref:WD40 repeat protein n=1 Tax=Umboniibacter marinipuniceus TaxID=569599 RepID=A0A3M0AG90_9GAMM|nr:PD40 domain-containing protein [Umboniibacter marinipuniceus]RMA82639.1 WD40 repeat protein [Umboniibacter marinipuniceus]